VRKAALPALPHLSAPHLFEVRTADALQALSQNTAGSGRSAVEFKPELRTTDDGARRASVGFEGLCGGTSATEGRSKCSSR
jgi:hypothetical protein